MSDLDGRCFIKRVHPQIGEYLVPADIAAGEFLAEIKRDKEVIVTIRKARNPQHHRWFFALLKIVVDNTDAWGGVDDLLDDLKLAVGHVKKAFDFRTRTMILIPKSINFASMAEDQFVRFKERCLWKLGDHLGISASDLMDEADESQKESIEMRNARKAAAIQHLQEHKDEYRRAA